MAEDGGRQAVLAADPQPHLPSGVRSGREAHIYFSLGPEQWGEETQKMPQALNKRDNPVPRALTSAGV